METSRITKQKGLAPFLSNVLIIIIQCLTNWNPMALEAFLYCGLVIFKIEKPSCSNLKSALSPIEIKEIMGSPKGSTVSPMLFLSI